ncbi:CYTH domain-containing protein [Oliverpabstia intestinalis]|nr:CYTH domain-containing protein [Oliverpabstia intestinalis]
MVNQEIEKEMKIMISETQYEELIKELPSSKQIRNINFYFDDLDRQMIFNGNTVRVRANKEKMYLQFKSHIEKNGYTTVSKEFSKKLETLPYCIDSKILFELTGVRYPDVFLLGFLVTDRIICTLNSKIQIMLDKNTYLGCLDHEIEIEYTCEESELQEALKILKKYKVEISGEREIISKSCRFAQKYYNDLKYVIPKDG